MKFENVDDFVERKVLPEHRPIVAALRKIMREVAPGASEAIGYGIPVWRANRILAVISPTKKDITFAFSRGAEFEDKYKLLKGSGNVSKHIKFKTAEEVEKPMLRYYIKQALKLDVK